MKKDRSKKLKHMYLHIGNNKIIRTRDVIGIFDADTATVSHTTRAFLSDKERNGKLTTATDEVPRAFVLYGDKNKENICFSLLSAKTLTKRNAESEK